jgi:membrane associated rhomboid family serine protease
LLLIALVRQLIALVGALIFIIKFAVVAAFVGLMVLVILATLRERQRRRRREAEEL